MSVAAAARTSSRTYGEGLGANFGAEAAPFMTTRSLQRAELAVTELKVDRPNGQLSDPIPREDAFMICLAFKALPANEYWENGRRVSAHSVPAGSTTISDLRREPLAVIDRPVHTLLWYLPRTAFRTLTEQANSRYVDDLRYEPGVAVLDSTVRQLSLALLPAFRAPDRANRLFTDYLMLAFSAHIAQVYGGMLVFARDEGGRLAPWQERRAKEIILADLAGSTPLPQLAEACGLSVSHFAHAFRRTTGLPPHAWLLRARVERAMTLLRGGNKSLSDIALACGFTDQSHFTRVFRRRVGVTPGAWRRIAVS
jgi:AraC family transcriptional regulator